MELVSILDKKACGSAIGVNTGKLGCLSLFGTPTHLMLVKKGYKIPIGQELSLEYISEQVQKGIFIPVIDSSSFEDLSAEDTYSTNSSGVKRLNLQGLVELKFMFEEGHEFYRELDKLQSFKGYDLLLIDDEDNWLVVKNSDGTTGGFSLGHITPEKRSFKVKGGDAEMKSLVLQMLNRKQYDSNYGIAHYEELGFTAQEIALINGVDLSFDAIPSDLATTFTINAKLNSDNNTNVLGLLVANFSYKVNGATVVITSVTESADGVYDFVVPALALNDVITLELWDGTVNVNVAKDAGGVLYRSEVATETVIA